MAGIREVDEKKRGTRKSKAHDKSAILDGRSRGKKNDSIYFFIVLRYNGRLYDNGVAHGDF